MTSLRFTYRLLKQNPKTIFECNYITGCNKDSCTPPLDIIGLPTASPHFLLIFFQNLLISLFYVLCLEYIFCFIDNNRLYYAHEHTDETKNHRQVFSNTKKTSFSLGGNKFISCSHPGSY